MRWMTVPLFAAFVFGIFGSIAAGSVEFTLRTFAQEVGVHSAVLVAVPGLFAMFFAMLLYQDAEKRITTISQSLSRAILVALLAWIGFSALATWAWGSADWAGFFSKAMLISGVIGGGPMLIAALAAGWLVGWLIKRRGMHWFMED